MKFPKHISLEITHNEHAIYYETLENYFGRPQFEGEDEEMKKRCLEAGEIWECNWYPLTPSSFFYVFAPTIEEMLKLINE